MPYDERYTPFLRRAQLLGVASIVARGMPTFNSAALTALVDRWRPETHTFHLPCGEMTVTLQDVAMLIALPIRGEPVTGRCESAGWRDRVAGFLGTDPPADPEGRRGRSAGVKLVWLRERFGICPVDADEDTVSFHARAWILHMFGTVLFPDATGDIASWMFIPCLMDWDQAGTYSWGSAVLAFLYRQLCEACRRRKAKSSLGGCVYLLQLWMWTRLPVGRPTLFEPRAWTPEGVEDRRPTVAYLWESVSSAHGQKKRAYVEYSNEIDALSASSVSVLLFTLHCYFITILCNLSNMTFVLVQVNWWPYSEDHVQALEANLGLHPLCRRDDDLWTMRCPLICFYAVEYHLPGRVIRQFGRQQPFPPDQVSTSIELHK